MEIAVECSHNESFSKVLDDKEASTDLLRKEGSNMTLAPAHQSQRTAHVT